MRQTAILASLPDTRKFCMYGIPCVGEQVTHCRPQILSYASLISKI